jgi:hypothetical protein
VLYLLLNTKNKIKMIKEKFTKGDWHVSGDVYPVIESKSDRVETLPTIATINSTFRNKEEYTANAKLISAAPDMYSALESSLQMLEQTLVYRNANDLRMGNVFLEATITQVKDAMSKAVS